MHIPPRSYGSAKALARQSFVARRLVLPTQAFFHTEGPGGVLLLICSVIALALAIADDVGAILVIALFSSSGVSWAALGVAAGILVAIVAMIRGGVRSPNAYLVAGLAFWAAMLGSGVHATLAGVILGATTPI